MDAQDVHNSSYVWKSILAAQPILKQDCCWSVGNGSAIWVLKDKWILNHPTNRVLHPPLEEEWEWRVNELIDWNYSVWDRQLIVRSFHREDVEAIMRIPLSHGHAVDALLLLYSKNGEYSVKSGYQTARQIKSVEEERGECSMARNEGAVWRILWKLHIPTKIKFFAWQALYDILPTYENLVHRRIVNDGTYQLCQKENETVLHALWECSVAKDVWAGCSRELQKHVGGQNDLMHLFEELLHKLSVEVFELFLVQLWLIWSQHNVITYGGVMQDPTRLGQQAREFLEEYRQAQLHLSLPTATPRSRHTWNLPPRISFKLNFDVVVFNDINASRTGAVIRNDMGRLWCHYLLEVLKLLTTRRQRYWRVAEHWSWLLTRGPQN